MPRVCSVCSSADRGRIEEALLAGMAKRRIAALYGVSQRSLGRHVDHGHVAEALAKAADAAEVVRADSLLEQVRQLQDRAMSVLAQAEAASALGAATGAIREARSLIELQARLVGQLDENTRLSVIVGTAVEVTPQAESASDFAVWGEFLYRHELGALDEALRVVDHLQALAQTRADAGVPVPASPPEWVGADYFDHPHREGTTPWLQVGRGESARPYITCLLEDAE